MNRAGGRSGSLRNIGRIEQWNFGSGAPGQQRKAGSACIFFRCAVTGLRRTRGTNGAGRWCSFAGATVIAMVGSLGWRC